MRLRGNPHNLALGMSFGVFTGLMPIIPFQTILAVTLALFFKGSKITAAIGTWISNPLNWYLLYYSTYHLGSNILGLPEQKVVFSAIVNSINSGEASFVVAGKMLGAGSSFLLAFLLGGIIVGSIIALPSYVFFLHFFRRVKTWREARIRKRKWRKKKRRLKTH